MLSGPRPGLPQVPNFQNHSSYRGKLAVLERGVLGWKSRGVRWWGGVLCSHKDIIPKASPVGKFSAPGYCFTGSQGYGHASRIHYLTFW